MLCLLIYCGAFRFHIDQTKTLDEFRRYSSTIFSAFIRDRVRTPLSWWDILETKQQRWASFKITEIDYLPGWYEGIFIERSWESKNHYLAIDYRGLRLFWRLFWNQTDACWIYHEWWKQIMFQELGTWRLLRLECEKRGNQGLKEERWFIWVKEWELCWMVFGQRWLKVLLIGSEEAILPFLVYLLETVYFFVCFWWRLIRAERNM